MEKLTTQDQQKILTCLQEGPLTVAEISQRIRISVPRVNLLIQTLSKHGAVQTSRCAQGTQSRRVNVWELRTPTQPLE